MGSTNHGGMRRRVTLGLALVASAAMLVPSPSSAAEPTRVVSVGFTYVLPDTEVPQGTALELLNLDVAPHNITSLVTGRNGSPLFSSDTVSVAGQALVKGVERLRPGVYDYTCTVHPSMLGSLVVT